MSVMNVAENLYRTGEHGGRHEPLVMGAHRSKARSNYIDMNKYIHKPCLSWITVSRVCPGVGGQKGYDVIDKRHGVGYLKYTTHQNI